MTLTKSKERLRFISLILSILFIASFQWNSFALATNQTQKVRELVSVWFDLPLRGYSRNSKPNLEVMINLISEKYGGFAMDNVPILDYLSSPETISDNKVLKPIVAAKHNRRTTSDFRIPITSDFRFLPPVSFDLSPASGIADNPTYYNSFLVAKHYADEANKIFPGTVDTLVLHQDDYLRVHEKHRHGHKNIPTELHSAWESLNQTESNSENNTRYKLGVTVSYGLCTNGSDSNSTEILSKFVEYADTVLPVIYFESPRRVSPCEEHDKQLELLHTCEQNLHKLKPDVETIPIVMCKSPAASSDADDEDEFLKCWQLMTDWAIRNERKVIMWEAFSRDDSAYVCHAGRWQVKNQWERQLTEKSFVKRAERIAPTCTLSNRWTTTISPNFAGNFTVTTVVNNTVGLNVTMTTTETTITRNFNEAQVLNITNNITTEKPTADIIHWTADLLPSNASSSVQSSTQTSILMGNEDIRKEKYNGSQDSGRNNFGYILMITIIVLACLVLAGFSGAYVYKRLRTKGSGSYSRTGGDEQYGLL